MAFPSRAYPHGNLDTVQAANPIEKLILYRLLKLLHLNIQFIFVFDGMNRPRGKRGKHGGGGIQWKEITPLKSLLKQLGVAQHIAPGEAEVECAALQRHGVVDAVWSEDSDCLMFGCTTQIRDFREGGKKSETKVRVYRAEAVKETCGLDREGLVAFAVLNGGDYDITGLKGCGPKLAIQAVRRGMGKSLCDAVEKRIGMGSWRSELVEFLREHRKPLEIPPNYPSMDKVRLYYKPLVSDLHQLENLNALRTGWDLEINEAKLREHLRDFFNFFTKEYMKHITPVLLARLLVHVQPEVRALSNRCDIQPAKRSKKEIEEAAAGSRKISFKATEVTHIDIGKSITGDLEMGRQKTGPLYDPEERIECELLDVVLRRTFPCRDFTFSAPPGQKRKGIEGPKRNDVRSNISPQNARQKKRKSDVGLSDDSQGPLTACTGNEQPRKKPRHRSKHKKEENMFTTGINEINLKNLGTDQMLRELTPGSDLPDIDSIFRKNLVALAPAEATTHSLVLAPRIGAVTQTSTSASKADIIDLPDD